MAQLSRREFLIAANATALLALIESCVPGAASHVVATPSASGNPYDRALRLLRDAVRRSPDHLARRAADVVATKDAAKIAEFVRDHVSVVPPWSAFVDDARSARRWGIEATLRGGQGTLRDRADLLARMLTDAGFKARVVAADRPQALGLAELYRPRRAEFAPDGKLVAQAAALLRSAGAPPPASPSPVDLGPDPTAAILAALPSALQNARLRDDLLPRTIPVVELDDGGRKRYAMALGDTSMTDTPPAGLAGAPAAEPTANITVTVSAVSNAGPGSSNTPRGRLVELVSGRWSAEAVVGKQVLLTFVPPGGTKSYLESSLATQQVRVPVLRVQGDDPSLVAAGPLITVHGDVAPQSQVPASSAALNGPCGVIKVLSDADRKAAVASVASARVMPNGVAFPDVTLDVDLLDAAGTPVDGLDARALRVDEQGKAVDGFTVVSNVRTQKRPRVMIAYDLSGSVAGAWKSPAARAAFDKKLVSAIVQAAGITPFDTQLVFLGADPDPAKWAPPDAGALTSALATAGSASETWATIAGPALDQGLSAIVYVGDSTDDTTSGAQLAEMQHRLAASGVPVVLIPSGPPPGATARTIVELSGGVRLVRDDPTTASKVASFVQQRAAAWVSGGYRIRYVAPADGPAERTVTVSLTDRPAVSAAAKYTVPAKPLSPPSFAALYVTIEAGGLTAVRHLAGLQVNDRGGALGQLDDPVALAETRAALDGITTIAIEPGTPTTGALLDDVLSSLISVEPLRAIWPVKDMSSLTAAVKGSVRRTPGVLMALLRAIDSDANAVPALRVAILHERVVSESVIERHADLAIGANPWIAVTPDAHAGFKAAVANSVAACAGEAAAFDDSAFRRLSGRSLITLPKDDNAARAAFHRTVPAAKLDAWARMSTVYSEKHLLVPAGGAVDALWVVDPDTGASKPVLLDGTGGAVVRSGCHFSPFAEMAITLSMLAAACDLSGESGCLGIDTAATAMTVAALFIPGEADAGTPFGAMLGTFSFFGGGFGALGGAIGIALIIVTIQASCS